MGFFDSIGKAVKSVGKAAGSVVKAAGSVVGNVAHSVVSNVPIVKNVYGIATSLTGKDLTDVVKGATGAIGGAMQGGWSEAGKGAVEGFTGQPVLEPAPSDAALDMQGLTTSYNPANVQNLANSYNGMPTVNGISLPLDNISGSYSSNPLMMPAMLNTGMTAQAVGGNQTLNTILDIIQGASKAVKDGVNNNTPQPQNTTNLNTTGMNKNVLWIGGGIAALLAAFLIFRK